MAENSESHAKTSSGDARRLPSLPKDRAALAPPRPTLATYYGEPSPKFPDWLKAIRTIGSFSRAEIDEALRFLSERDPDIRKTLALATVANPPPALRSWLTAATQQLLADHLKETTIDLQLPAHELIGQIAAGLAPTLRSKDRLARTAAESLLRLSIRFVTGARPNFDARAVLAALFPPLRGQADIRLAPAELRGRVQDAGIVLLRDLTLVQAAALEKVQSAESARIEANDRALNLEAALATERQRSRELHDQLAQVEARAQRLETEVKDLTRVIADNRQINAHGMAEIISRMRTLLAGRIDPLLADAGDALDVQPPELGVARDRIEFSRGVIKGEISWLDESSG